MGEKQHIWCDLCAVEIEFAAYIVELKSVAVQGHEPISEGVFKLCDACYLKLDARLAVMKEAADAKWDRNAPAKVSVDF
tara:strand:- start:818 stop:1054 length:237 start_codon:yes stop_codon:yes gene_type:complete